MSISVKEIMRCEPYTVGPYESVKKAEGIMRGYHIGGLPVVSQEQLVGILTSRDVRCSHPNRLVIDAMTRNVISVMENTTLWEAKTLMEFNEIERLPVTRNEKLIGIITKAKVMEEISKHIDALTTLPKSQLIIERSLELVQTNKDFAILFIDVDNFGIINKEYGHIIGDELLIQIGEFLKDYTADKSLAFRFGGDEFVLILIGTLEESVKVANMIVAASTVYKWIENIQITFTIGIAGGRRFTIRSDENVRQNIKNLINIASLMSSQAKKAKIPIKIAE